MSQATQDYFEDCLYCTPIFSNVALGEIFLRDVRDAQRWIRKYLGRI